MISITDSKIIQKFLTTLDKINQEFKKIYESDGMYNIKQGKIYCTSNINQMPRIVMGEYSSHSSTKLVNELFERMTITVNSAEYFEFRKNKKDPVGLIEIEDGSYIKFQTSMLKTTMIFEYEDYIDEPSHYTVLGKDLRTELNQLEVISKDIIMEETLMNELIKARSSSIKRLLLDTSSKTAVEGNYYDNVETYPSTTYLFEVSKKYLPSVGKLTLGVNFNLYKKEGNDQLYLVETVTDDKFFVMRHYDLLLNLQDY